MTIFSVSAAVAPIKKKKILTNFIIFFPSSLRLQQAELSDKNKQITLIAFQASKSVSSGSAGTANFSGSKQSS